MSQREADGVREMKERRCMTLAKRCLGEGGGSWTPGTPAGGSTEDPGS